MNTRMAEKGDPCPFEERVMEIKSIFAESIAGASCCIVAACTEVDSLKIPAAWGAPSVRPDNVNVTAALEPVAAPAMVRTIASLDAVTAGAVPVIEATLDAPEEKLAVPRK